MSSHTEAQDQTEPAAQGSGLWVRLAPWFSRLAALLGFGFIAAFLWQAGVFALLLPQTPVAPPVIDNPAEITSSDAKLTGFDKDNRPYWVAAEQGTQDGQNADIIHMKKITAQFSNTAGELFDVAAEGGDYSRSGNSITLKGNVRIVQGKRFTAEMPQALVKLKDKSLKAERDVVVNMASGEIRSQGMQTSDDGKSILFFNGVHAIFDESTPATGGTNP
jgi:lipopolysaccharide export system protein LptC